ncbi:MAG: alpha-glucosidase/alpha-galactosidase, partial [bacterium]
MKTNTKIVLVGAAGMAFGPVMVLDAVRAKKIRGATLVLMDIDEKRLKICDAAAQRINRDMGKPINIEMTTDIGRALDGAQFVILSVENKRFEFWEQDYEIPRRFGSRQIMGENGGPGGVFHALRSIKLIISICRDIERYCPDAMVLNLTNPMNPVTLAINRYTGLRNVGLCH